MTGHRGQLAHARERRAAGDQARQSGLRLRIERARRTKLHVAPDQALALAGQRPVEVAGEAGDGHQCRHAQRDADDEDDEVTPARARFAPGEAKDERDHAAPTTRPSRSATIR